MAERTNSSQCTTLRSAELEAEQKPVPSFMATRTKSNGSQIISLRVRTLAMARLRHFLLDRMARVASPNSFLTFFFIVLPDDIATEAIRVQTPVWITRFPFYQILALHH